MNTDKIANIYFGKVTKRLVNWFDLKVFSYYKAADAGLVRLVREIYREERGPVLLDPEELFMIYSLARTQRKHGGEYAEVDVFQGASSKAICEAKEGTPLHLFDTFAGLPSVGALDTRFKKGMFAASEAAVRARLAAYPQVFIYPGFFPDTAAPVAENRFSFVHLDVDTYESTKACLSFFYPRMLPGGIILSHDYSQCQGVRKAFDEFLETRPDTFIELPFSQCLVVKN
ncbi:MAG: TylF/MycF/NovP-related O-methyltransferase [bacterium]